MIRVIIADDQMLVRTGLSIIIDAEPDIEVVGQAANGSEAVEMALQLRPDLVCMDIRMPGMDGIEATKLLCGPKVKDPIPVLVVTTFDLDDYLFGALEAGASGFLLKDAPPETLLSAVRSVASGQGTLDQALTKRILNEFVSRKPNSAMSSAEQSSTSPALPLVNPNLPSSPNGDPQPQQNIPDGISLSPREIEIVTLVAQGNSNAEIAAKLFLETSTVKSHLARIMPKIDARDRLQVAVWAYQNRVVLPEH